MKIYGRYKPLIISILLAAFAFTACNDWLDVAPENDLIKEKFWKKTEDVESALAASYDAFRDASMASLIWGELRADMVTFGSDFNGYNLIAASNINPSNGVINWEGYYKAINLANTLMFYDKEVLDLDKTFTPEVKNAIDAEALFIRSLSYFYLVRLWKDVPLVIQPSISDTSELFLPKSPESEVIAQIIKDLLKAKDMAYTTEFKNQQKNTDQFYGRANKYSIMTLLADVYLWKQDYQKCIDLCDAITNTGLYSLEPYENWFNLYNPGNSPNESIFEIQFNDNLDAQDNPIYDKLLNQIRLSPISASKFNKDDLRTCKPINNPIWKYVGISLESPVSRASNARDANIIYYRYADILLMKAEALAELNRFQESNELLRETLERAGLSHVAVNTIEDLRTAILDERAREFIIEGKRWFDLLRFAKRNDFENKQLIISMILSGADIKQQAVLKTKVFDTMSYYLPIPEHEIIYNQNMVQNPFYDR